MIELTEPQVWVLIAVFTAAIFGMLSWQTTSFNRTLTTEIGAVRNELSLSRESADARIDGLREAMDAKFDLVNAKIDSLDRDVQALTRHVFGTDPR